MVVLMANISVKNLEKRASSHSRPPDTVALNLHIIPYKNDLLVLTFFY